MARKKGHWQRERCTVCSHPKIGIINFALARGISPLAVANEHGLGTSAMYNHNRAHIEDNYRKIIGSGVYADIDELLKKCTQGDAESLDVLNAMISGFFHNWSLAFANGSQAGMVAAVDGVAPAHRLRRASARLRRNSLHVDEPPRPGRVFAAAGNPPLVRGTIEQLADRRRQSGAQ